MPLKRIGFVGESRVVKSERTGEIDTLAPESQMIGMLTLEEVAAMELRKRSGAWRAILRAGEARKHLDGMGDGFDCCKRRLLMA